MAYNLNTFAPWPSGPGGFLRSGCKRSAVA